VVRTLWRDSGSSTKKVSSVELPTLTRREEKCCLTSMRTHFKLPVVLLGLVALPLVAASAASGLEQFKTGDPAKAELVNKNFKYLDSTKAESTDVQLLKSAITAKVDNSAIDSIVAKKLSLSTSGFVTRDTVDAIVTKTVLGKADIVALPSQIEAILSKGIKSSINTSADGSFSKLVISPPSSAGKLTISDSAIDFGVGGDWSSYSANPVSRISPVKDGLVFSFAPSSRWAPIFTESVSIGAAGLAVKGNINLGGSLITPAKSFPDFVFSPSYKLPSLTETESYIYQNGHLPNVPSAKEVEKSGMDLVQMNQILLQKVEELTLHAIAQQKQIEELKTRIPAP